MGALSFHQVMEGLFPNSQAARDFQKRTRQAERDVSRARISARERFEDHLRERWGKGKLGQSKIIAQLSQRKELKIKVRGWKAKVKEKLTPEQAQDILIGKTKAEFSDDPIALASLRQALADFNLKRLQDQSRAQFVRFDRVKSRADATPLVISPLETVYLLQLAAQEQYLPALDRYGYTQGVIESLRKQLPDQACDIADFLAVEYAGEYDRLNPVFRDLFHMDMPRVKNYAPGSFEHAMHASTPDPDGIDGTQVNALSAGLPSHGNTTPLAHSSATPSTSSGTTRKLPNISSPGPPSSAISTLSLRLPTSGEHSKPDTAARSPGISSNGSTSFLPTQKNNRTTNQPFGSS